LGLRRGARHGESTRSCSTRKTFTSARGSKPGHCRLAASGPNLALDFPHLIEEEVGARIELEDKLTATLRRGLQRRLPKLYDQARRGAEASLRVHGEDAAAGALPAKCPYRLADLLRHDWHPASRHGLAP
jgi:hypothetical protein